MRSRSPLPLIGLLIALGLIFFLTTGGHLYSPDEEVMFRVTDSLARGRLSVAPMEMTFGTQEGRGGREYAQYGLGNSLAALPLYWSGRVVNALWDEGNLRGVLTTASLVNARRYDYPTSLSHARRHAVSFMNLFVTLLQVWVIFLFARDVTRSEGRALLVAALYGFATQAWPHAKTFFSEPLATLGLTAGAYLIWRGMRTASVRALWGAGALLALAVLTRLDSLVALPGLALLFYLPLLGFGGNPRFAPDDPPPPPPPALRAHLAVGLPVALALGLILLLNVYKFGSPLSTGYADQEEGFAFSASLAESLPGFLWSPGRSLILHSPPVLLGLVGFFALFRLNAALGLGIAVTFGMTLVVQGLWQNWSGGWDWGPRHIFSLIAWSMIPLAALLSEASPLAPRTGVMLCVLVGAVGVAVQTVAISQNPIEFYQVFYFQSALPNGYPVGEYYEIALEEGVEPPTIEDSIWERRWSAWDGYPRLWNRGVHDLFWLRWWQWRQRGEAALE